MFKHYGDPDGLSEEPEDETEYQVNIAGKRWRYGFSNSGDLRRPYWGHLQYLHTDSRTYPWKKIETIWIRVEMWDWSGQLGNNNGKAPHIIKTLRNGGSYHKIYYKRSGDQDWIDSYFCPYNEMDYKIAVSVKGDVTVRFVSLFSR